MGQWVKGQGPGMFRRDSLQGLGIVVGWEPQYTCLPWNMTHCQAWFLSALLPLSADPPGC